MDANFLTLKDLANRQPGAVEFWSHGPATNSLPRAPDFMFGPLPEEFTRIYYRHTNLWAVGIFRARGFSVMGGYTLLKDGEIFCCPEANIHPAHEVNFLATFGDPARPRQRLSIAGQAVLLAGPGYHVYGHWLSDILSKILLLHASGLDILNVKILFPDDVPSFGFAWLELLGIPPENLIRYNPIDQVPWVEELLIPTTFHNGVRMAPDMKAASTLLLQLIERRHGAAPAEKSHRIFVSRGLAPRNRMFRDRERVEHHAIAAGLAVVHPQNLTLLEQVRLFQNASMVIGEYGSALHGTLFSPPGTVVCALRGSLAHPGFVQSGLGHALDQPTGYVFGRNELDNMNSDFTVSEAAFVECLEMLVRTGCVDTFPVRAT